MQEQLDAIQVIENLTANVNMGADSKISNRAFHLSLSRATNVLRQYFTQLQQNQALAKSQPKPSQTKPTAVPAAKKPQEKAANA